MGGFFANVFGIEEETEEDVIRSEAEEEEEAEESEEQRDAEQKRTVQCFQRMGTHRKLRLLSEESAAEVRCTAYSADGGAVWLEWLDKPDKNPSERF